MRKYILYGIIIFQIALIISLVRGIQLSRRSAIRIATMQETKLKLEEESKKLKEQAEYVQSPYYLEKVARDELHMSKPGETVVIVPEEVETGENMSETSQDNLNTKEKSNWMRWIEILSGKIH